jgi:hypothetical protein
VNFKEESFLNLKALLRYIKSERNIMLPARQEKKKISYEGYPSPQTQPMSIMF